MSAPKLWGDGVHDDTEAIEWRALHGLALTDGPGTYIVSRTIVVPDWRGLYPMCMNPDLCRGRSSCPRDPACNE